MKSSVFFTSEGRQQNIRNSVTNSSYVSNCRFGKNTTPSRRLSFVDPTLVIKAIRPATRLGYFI